MDRTRETGPTTSTAAHTRSSWWQRLKARWQWRTSGTTAIEPVRIGEVAGITLADYAPATEAAPASKEIAAHNMAIEAEYQTEVHRRKAELEAGLYHPRFVHARPDPYQEVVIAGAPEEHRAAIRQQMIDERVDGIKLGFIKPRVDEVDWDLEMSLLQGRRTNVTHDSGRPRLEPATAERLRDEMALNRMRARVHTLEAVGARPPVQQGPPTLRQLVGSREDVLKAVHGDVAAADQLEAHAMQTFGVTSMDDIIR